MTNKAGQTNSVEVEEHMIFWIDDAAKTFILSDGRRLRISRFDKSWISASSDDIQYEFNRTDRTLTYAGSTTKDSDWCAPRLTGQVTSGVIHVELFFCPLNHLRRAERLSLIHI